MQWIRTDMAQEALTDHGELAGVTEQRREADGVATVYIRVETQQAAETLKKPIGTYVTIEAKRDMALASDMMSKHIAEALSELMRDIPGHVLVVGLGNRYITPDSLGPRTVEKLFVTRHIRSFAPELAPDGMREVSAIVPGVLGVTGLETCEMVQGVVENTKPDAVLCIDALCSERVERIADVVQLNDSGILPGAGVGNRQQGLNRASLGVPVLAVGVPTVVYASTIARETIRLIEQKTGVGDADNSLSTFAGELIDERMGELIVTPKDVDQLVEDASRRLANGVNRALHGAQYEQLSSLLLH